MAWRVDRLLIDQHGIDHAAHLDQLLPVAAVAGEARDLARADRADLAEAHLRHHALEAGALDAARRRAAKIIVDDLDLGPAERRQTIPHGILQRAALAVVQHLMGRRLADIEQRLALQMMGADLLRDHDRPPVAGGVLLAACSRISRAISLISAAASPPAVPATPARRRAAGLAASEQIHLLRLAPPIVPALRPLTSPSSLTWASPRFWSREALDAPESGAFDDAARLLQHQIEKRR